MMQSGLAARRIAEDITSQPWEPASPGPFEVWRTITAGDGKKTMRAEFKDAVGNMKSVSSATILDTRPPVITPVTPQPDSQSNSVVGFKVRASWADDTSVTTDVSGVDGSGLQVFWYDGVTGETTDVTNHPRMTKTATEFTFEPVVVPNQFYTVEVLKPDRAGNLGTEAWGFWT